VNDRIAASRARALATLRRTQAVIRRVIAANETLREFPGHEDTADARIAEGEQELARAEAEIAAIEAADPPERSDPR
jgi:hypothetical protein